MATTPITELYCPNCNRHAREWPERLVRCGCWAHIYFRPGGGVKNHNEIASIVELCHHLPTPLRELARPRPRYRPATVLEYSMGHPL